MWMIGLLCGAVMAVWHLDRQADQLFPSLLREAHFLNGLFPMGIARIAFDPLPPPSVKQALWSTLFGPYFSICSF